MSAGCVLYTTVTFNFTFTIIISNSYHFNAALHRCRHFCFLIILTDIQKKHKNASIWHHIIIIIIKPAAVPQHSCGCGIRAHSASDETSGDCRSPSSHIRHAADRRWRPGHVDAHTDLCEGWWSAHSMPACLAVTTPHQPQFTLCTHTHIHTYIHKIIYTQCLKNIRYVPEPQSNNCAFNRCLDCV